MARRLVLVTALLLTAAIYALAAERVTLILNDGRRISGEIGAHGPQGENREGSFLVIVGDGGRVERVQLDNVAVMEFAAGTAVPSPSELQQLPAGANNVLVLKNGAIQGGTFIDLYRGDTLTWRNQANQTQQYAVVDVDRVYINPLQARAALGIPPAPQTSVGTTGQVLGRGGIRVEATQRWVDTGLRVRKGDRVAFNATGQIQFSPDPAQLSGPDGSPAVQNPAVPISIMPVGGLIGKVGNSEPFPIGSNTQPIIMPADGRLFLGVNDTDLGDNGGFFEVGVLRQRR